MDDPARQPVPDTGSRRCFARSPLVVIWEVARACDPACVHGRASAIAQRESGELSTREAENLLREIKAFGKPLMVFTGGDPLQRPDLFDLIAAASREEL